MKKLILILGFLALFGAFGLRGYFTLIPPSDPTLNRPLAEIVPADLPGWTVTDLDIAGTPESSERVSERLKYDDALVRVFERGNTQVTLYIAYWAPGTVPYRWAGAHTPDTCWVQAGWSCLEREYSVPFQHDGIPFQPAEFGVYEKDGRPTNVHFWHLVGGESFGYGQENMHNIFGALHDVRHYGLDLRREQFFIRLSSNRDLDELRRIGGFDKILDSLVEIGLTDTPGEA